MLFAWFLFIAGARVAGEENNNAMKRDFGSSHTHAKIYLFFHHINVY